MFILLEGPEGGGKTTQAKILVDYLNSKKKKAIYVKCPGFTDIGKEIRRLSLAPDSTIQPKTHLFLMLADMWETSCEIDRLIQEGYIVICDRYYFSSLAYSGSDGMDLQLVSQYVVMTEFKNPDLTILLDIDPTVGLNRKEVQGEILKFELKGVGFQEKVREIYLEIYNNFQKKKHLSPDYDMQLIQTNGMSYDEVTQKIKELVDNKG